MPIRSGVITFGLAAAAYPQSPVDSWLTFHGSYDGRRHSSLSQITPENVGQLKQQFPNEDAFKQVCSACHATGVNGAPKVGDHAAWSEARLLRTRGT